MHKPQCQWAAVTAADPLSFGFDPVETVDLTGFQNIYTTFADLRKPPPPPRRIEFYEPCRKPDLFGKSGMATYCKNGSWFLLKPFSGSHAPIFCFNGPRRLGNNLGSPW